MPTLVSGGDVLQVRARARLRPDNRRKRKSAVAELPANEASRIPALLFSGARPPAGHAHPPQHVGLILDLAMAQRLAPALFRALHPSRVAWLVDLERPLEELLATIRSRRPAALLTRWTPTVTERLLELGLPTVVFNEDIVRPEVESVVLNEQVVGARAAEHLINRGFRSFAFVGNDQGFCRRRSAAFREALMERGLPAPAEMSLPTMSDRRLEYAPGSATLVRWLRALPKPAGLFAGFDRLGWHVQETCRAAGLVVPDDIAILGVNNDELVCGLSRPPLSSIRLPWEHIGAELALAVERLLGANAEHPARPPVMVEPEGVATRRSTDLIAMPDPIGARALAFIREHAHKPITIKDLVRTLAVSRRSVEYAFRQNLARTPAAELLRIRVERAKALLIDTKLSMTLVAEQCGFNYTERFSLAFRRATGLTPSGFRRRHHHRAR